MACIKKLHDKLGKVGKVNAKFVKFAMQIFLCSLRPDHIRTLRILHFCCIFTTANILFYFNGAPENFNFWGEQRHKSPVNLAERY